VKGTLNGWEVARQIREIEPEFPVVYMTGASGDKWASQGVPNSILLQKPFAPAQLVTAVSQLLNAGTPPSTTSPWQQQPYSKDVEPHCSSARYTT